LRCAQRQIELRWGSRLSTLAAMSTKAWHPEYSGLAVTVSVGLASG
jgi:hypothetical protein